MPFYPAPVASSSVLSEVTYTFTTAELASANGSPVTILAAQGSGTAVIPVSGSFQYKGGAAAFNNPATEMYVLGAGGFDFLLRGASGYAFDSTTSFVATLTQVAIDGSQASLENAGLVFALDADPVDGGSADGTGRITVVYYVMTLA